MHRVGVGEGIPELLNLELGVGVGTDVGCEEDTRRTEKPRRALLPDNLFMYSYRTISYRQGSVEGGALSSLKRPSNNGRAIRNIAG